MNNQEVRFNILKKLYEKERNSPGRGTSSADLLKELSISENDLSFNIRYLEDKYWVKLTKFLGGNFIANITSEGIDLVENDSGLKQAFPTLNFVIQNGQVNMANQNSSNIRNTVNITSYEEILKEAEKLENKEEIKKHIKAIQTEDKKKDNERDSNVITKSWKFIKNKAPSIIPLIEPIVKRLLGL